MKKVTALLLLATLAFTGCSSATKTETTAAQTQQTEATQAQTKAEETKTAATGTLVLSTFGLSEDISAEEVYTPFEQQFNCKLVTETGTASERYTKLASDTQSTVDVIELSQALTAKGVDAGLFEDIDLSKLSNSEDLIDTVKTFAQQGNGVAYTLNSIGIMYDPAVVGEITSFNDLWKAELEGKVAIPEITTTFGPAIVHLASDYKNVDIKTDNGKAAFEALTQLKPNIVKTYSKSSDLVNMFTSGEISVAVVGDFAVPIIKGANPNLVYYTPESTYANFNIISINKNSKNKDLAYAYLNYRISPELQTKTGTALNEAPTNKKVTFSEAEAANMTYGDTAAKAKFIDYKFVNPLLDSWIDQWNRTLNN